MVRFVVPCAGRGSRVSSFLPNTPKHLVDVHGHTILGQIVKNIRSYFNEAPIYVIISADNVEDFERFRDSENDNGISLLLQEHPNGTRNALREYYIHSHNNEDDVCVVYADNIVCQETFFQYLSREYPPRPLISVVPFTPFDVNSTSVQVQGDLATCFAHGRKRDRAFRWAGRLYLPAGCRLLRDLMSTTLLHPQLNSRAEEQSIGTFLGEFGNYYEINVVREEGLINLNTPKDYLRLTQHWKRYFGL